MEEREDRPLVVGKEALVDRLVQARPAELHAVLLAEALDLAVTEAGQAGQGGQQGSHPEVLVAGPELLDRGLLVRVAHEVHEPAEDRRVELEGVLHDQPVVRVVLVAEHVHECAVVDPVHPQGPHEVAFEQPERLGQQERAGCLDGDPIHHLPPELVGHQRLEGAPAHAPSGSRRDRPAGARLGEPQPLDVALGQDHGGVEADHRELAGHGHDRPDHGLADVLPSSSRAGPCRSRGTWCRRCRGRRSGRRRLPGRRAGRRPRRRSRRSSGPRSGSPPARRRTGRDR